MSAEQTQPDIEQQIDEIVNRPWPDFSWPLEIARNWVRSDGQKRDQAPELLRRLRTKYPHALQFGEEHILALIECGRLPEAERVLRALEPEFGSPDEEILCRWGRIFKDRGDEHLGYELETEATWTLAAECYRKAADRYKQAYAIRNGHYPAINWATLLLILGTLQTAGRTELLQQCESLARDLLSHQADWCRILSDDNIWHTATAGEAYLLLRQWDDAVLRYKEAQHEPNCQPFHQASLRKQVVRILSAFRRIGVDDFGPFNNLDELFPVQPAATGPIEAIEQTKTLQKDEN